MNLDVLVFGAHPDDVELSMGGTISKFTSQDYKVGIIDLTRGELGTRGTPEIRQKEAFEAALALKATLRENLNIQDGFIDTDSQNIMKIVIEMRKYKPKIVFSPYFNDRHPDHISTSSLVKRAMFLTGLEKVKTFDKEVSQTAFRPKKIFYYMQTYTFDPTFIVDVSDCFQAKMNAVNSYSSQFYNPKSTEPETFISRPIFIDYIEARARHYGFQIGKKYGEPFFCEEKIELDIHSFLK
jgi:bacillithiol biosynthesis deacetylase BshB1